MQFGKPTIHPIPLLPGRWIFFLGGGVRRVARHRRRVRRSTSTSPFPYLYLYLSPASPPDSHYPNTQMLTAGMVVVIRTKPPYSPVNIGPDPGLGLGPYITMIGLLHGITKQIGTRRASHYAWPNTILTNCRYLFKKPIQKVL